MRNRIGTIDTIPAAGRQALAATGGAFGRAVRRVVAVVLAWQQRARERRALAMMDEHTLHDLGLSRVDIMIELDKPFWRP
ncbi:MAG: DUF1127 domain-containing protein [Alphaproteobacteria bacterium]|nr:DUF1127 domain-containing protein [Alphaproteobacteria bacterium]